MNAGRTPNRRRKSKREVEAQESEEKEEIDTVAVGRVSEKVPGNTSKQKEPSNTGYGYDLYSDQDEDMEADGEASGEIKKREGEDDDIITPEEQAHFDALWEANIQRNRTLRGSNPDPNAVGRQGLVGPKPGVPRGRAPNTVTAAIESQNPRRRRNHEVSLNHGANPSQSSAPRRRRARSNTYGAEDNQPVVKPRGRKRARNEALSGEEEEDTDSDVPLSKRRKRKTNTVDPDSSEDEDKSSKLPLNGFSADRDSSTGSLDHGDETTFNSFSPDRSSPTGSLAPGDKPPIGASQVDQTSCF